MRKCVLNEQGEVVAVYNTEVHENIPANAVVMEEGVDYVFFNPIEYVTPTRITKVQAMKVLKSIGLWESFNALVGSNQDVKDEWELATELQRHHTFITQLSPALGLSSEQLDQLFIDGSKL